MKGLTLVEVLVALAMVAVALAAGLALQASLAARADRAPEALVAEVCARNRLAELRLSRQLPAAGEQTLACEQAGRQLQVLTQVTEVQGFRQVRVRVQRAGAEGVALLQVATVLGRY